MASIKIKQGDEWVKIPNIGIVQGVEEAPKDGNQYARKDGEWSEINAEITIDTELSDTSTNAVQNKVVKENLDAKQPLIDDLEEIRTNASEAVKPSSLSTVATSGSYDDLTDIPTKITNLRSYTTARTVTSLLVNYENIYVTLTANSSLSVSASGSAYNGRTITAYVYTAAARTITIPTTGNYISMCGSSYTTTAGGWVEFNLTCIAGKWHIAKLEQE